MSQEQQDVIIALVALAKEEQEIVSALIDKAEDQEKSVNALCGRIDTAGKSITKKIETVLATIPNEIRQGAQVGANEAVQGATVSVADSMEAATKSLQAAAAEGQASARALSRTSILQGAFLLVVALVMGFVGWAGVGYLIDRRASDLGELMAQVEVEKATLAALQSETWGLELITFRDGTRAIILPKGIKYSHNGEMKDEKGKKSGRIGIVIKP